MDKLIELLNEYEEEHNSDLYYKFELENGELYCYDDVTDVLWTMQDEAMVVCSKQFGFIKWLVKNDKIDRDKSKIITAKTEIVLGMNFTDVFVITKRYWLYEQLLMILAIQDEPINFLVSILK